MRTVQREVWVSPPISHGIHTGKLDPDLVAANIVSVDKDHKQLRKQLRAPERALVAWKSIDDLVSDGLKDQKVPSCRKGCAHCCSQEIQITFDEASRLAKLSPDWSKLEKQVGGVANLPYAERACVFLSLDKTCSIYENRPTACRKYFVYDDPDKCNSDKYPEGNVAVGFVTKAELLATGLMNCQESGPMPEMLLRVRK